MDVWPAGREHRVRKADVSGLFETILSYYVYVVCVVFNLTLGGAAMSLSRTTAIPTCWRFSSLFSRRNRRRGYAERWVGLVGW